MHAGFYRFMIGEFECHAVRDDAFNYSLGSLFANVP